ncbi:MAG: hypothetical protein ACP5OA_07370 [Candidatus Woesearchaeota archaeon]
MNNRFNPDYRKNPTTVIYNPENNLDKIISITIDGPNSQIIEPLNIEISRPYIKHVVNKDKTYILNNKGVQIASLGNIFKTEAFGDAIIFEFYKESDNDSDPDIRANELYHKLNEKKHRRKLPLEITLITMPDSRVDHHEENEKYLVLQANEMDGYSIRQFLVK